MRKQLNHHPAFFFPKHSLSFAQSSQYNSLLLKFHVTYGATKK
ncbi:MAG: hypothetical protein QM726_10590 [Chitinophagaceae bacterium]